MDMNQYLDMFIEESKEHLQAVNDKLLLLENHSTDMTIVQEIFRSAHTLKGMSATMGFNDLASLTHQMENVLDGVRNGELKVTSEMIDVLFQSLESLEIMVYAIADNQDGKHDVTKVVNNLQILLNGGNLLQETAASIEEMNQLQFELFESQTLRNAIDEGFSVYEIQVALRDDCVLKAVRAYMVMEKLGTVGEVVKTNPAPEVLEEGTFDQTFFIVLISKEKEETIKKLIEQVSEVEGVELSAITMSMLIQDEKGDVRTKPEIRVNEENTGNLKQEKTVQQENKKGNNRSIRVNIEKLDSLMNLFEELIIDKGRLTQKANEIRNKELTETVERISRVTSDIQSIILTMRMVPVETVFNRFPRMVRQLAKDLGKKIQFEMVGQETELDRTVLDEIGDPLVHLIRNAVDHGIELPIDRIDKGKQETGSLLLEAYHSGNHVYIDIKDDGKGLDREKLLKKAIKNGMISEEKAHKMSDKEVYALIFASGFSTAEQISDISGRGVGLDVVKNTIEQLGGNITIDSQLGKGTIFSIELPMTLSIISSLLVEVSEQTYGIALAAIVETVIVKRTDVVTLHNQKVIQYRGNAIPLLHLHQVFQEEKYKNIEKYPVVIVKKGEKYAALAVDKLIGQQEIVVKPLGSYLADIVTFSGATILGDGKVALIIDSNQLVK